MGKKNRNKVQTSTKNKQVNNSNQTTTTKPVTITNTVTKEDVVSSTSQAEFEAKKESLIQQFSEDIEFWETQKTTAENAANEAEKRRKELEQQKSDLISEIDNLRNDLEKKQKNADAYSTKVRGEADKIRKEADNIKINAEKERIEKLQKASDDASELMQRQADKLEQQIVSLNDRENQVREDKRDLERRKREFEDEKEALEELIADLKDRKKRYDKANPAQISFLESQLDYEKASREKLSQRVAELEILLDNIKTEIEDPEQGTHTTSVKEIVTSLHELRDKYDRLVSIYSEYPDDAAIAKLREKADKADKLEAANETLTRERDRFKEEALAEKNTNKELEIVKRSVEATNALNEHLLQELESHKTALESRTGDTCPSLSNVDTETETSDFKSDIARRVRRQKLKSLREIVMHVKNYAGSRPVKEQLYYTDNDIRAFLAGMSVSRLLILQGMSGTGKSSLPRIFSEAISGFNKLIPVESSWRDRNELLGYYNDFNKKFNAKDFTIELYRSSKEQCIQIPTFIVLDEMNLARIEYYFSDFLAILQEPDHNKWLIRLVASDMRNLPMELPEDVKTRMEKEVPSIYSIWEKIDKARQGDLKSNTSDDDKELLKAYLGKLGQLTGAKNLIDGRKIKVTDNIWFVGTANRDESTFEISDKVYDRAQVVSLNHKGVSDGTYTSTTAKFISVSDLEDLFQDAIFNNKTRKEVEEKLNMLDTVLIDKFDLSFGNRIVTQTIDFTAVFVAAGGSLEDALDYQISTKILRKVITSDDAEALLELLDSVKDYKETTRLLEKRLRELK